MALCNLKQLFILGYCASYHDLANITTNTHSCDCTSLSVCHIISDQWLRNGIFTLKICIHESFWQMLKMLSRGSDNCSRGRADQLLFGRSFNLDSVLSTHKWHSAHVLWHVCQTCRKAFGFNIPNTLPRTWRNLKLGQNQQFAIKRNIFFISIKDDICFICLC